MKKFILLVASSLLFGSSAFAQPAPAAPTAPAATTPAPAAPANKATPPMAAPSGSVTAVCKDGTPYSGTTMKGACRGHGGVDKTAQAKGGAPAASSGGGTTSSMAAAGGGAGKVWANNSTKVYHCQGDKYYGKTKQGEYMSEADAKAKGFHPDHGKACK